LSLEGGQRGILISKEGLQSGITRGMLVERYRNPIKGWIKEVGYWVGLVECDVGLESTEIKVQEEEVASARWCEWDEAQELVTFEAGRVLLRSVMGMLDSGNAGFCSSFLL